MFSEAVVPSMEAFPTGQQVNVSSGDKCSGPAGWPQWLALPCAFVCELLIATILTVTCSTTLFGSLLSFGQIIALVAIFAVACLADLCRSLLWWSIL